MLTRQGTHQDTVKTVCAIRKVYFQESNIYIQKELHVVLLEGLYQNRMLPLVLPGHLLKSKVKPLK